MVTDSVRLLEKSNMLLLSKELNEKDKNLKSQPLITSEMNKKHQARMFGKKMFFL